MKLRMVGAVAVVAIVGMMTASAGAHDDPSNDGNNNSPKRCDTWYREAHARDAQGDADKIPKDDPTGSDNPRFDPNTGHSEDHEHGFDQGETGPLYVHNHTGHYVVRSDAFYIEVVGGGGYSRDGNNGGYVQGEVDPGSGAPDADFHGNFFGGTNGDMHSEGACVSVADNKVGDQGEQP